MPEKQESSGGPARTKTLVRGPDGALWLLSDTEAPKKLDSEQTAKVEDILTKTEAALSDEFRFFGHGVHVGHDCFDGHGVHCGEPEVSPD